MTGDCITCGAPPRRIGDFDIDLREFCFYLYMPIQIGMESGIRLPARLKPILPLIKATLDEPRQNFVYLTVKRMPVHSGSPGNRPGWHIDGFGSNGDVNYIWSDMNPTEFAEQQFIEIPTDDVQSMVEIEKQVREDRICTYPSGSLLRLDEGVVHRVNPKVQPGIRTFVKITFSNHQFVGEGNSHNYLFDYEWAARPRGVERNLDHC